MARPRLGEEERRGRTIGVRVTEVEESRERAQAARLSMGGACLRSPPRRDLPPSPLSGHV